jgi:phosphate transport system substrate-binding protein
VETRLPRAASSRESARRIDTRLSICLRVSFFVSLCLLLVGCREMLLPLDLQSSDVQVASQDSILVRVAVCWSALPLVEDLIEAYGDEQGHTSFDVLPGNSQNTLERIVSGGADLAIVAGQPEAAALAQSGDVRLGARVLALDAVAIIVAHDAPLERLSRDELAGLLGGRYADWQELRPGNGPPEPVSREEGAATRALVERVLLGQQALASTAVILPHDQGIVTYVGEHPQAIGYVSAALVDDRVKIVPIDGILPTDANVRNGQYPLTLPLVAVAPSPASRPIAGLIELANSSRGRSVIDRRYTLPR